MIYNIKYNVTPQDAMFFCRAHQQKAKHEIIQLCPDQCYTSNFFQIHIWHQTVF